MPISRPFPKKNASFASNRLSTNIPENWSLHGKRFWSKNKGRSSPSVNGLDEGTPGAVPARDGSPVDAPPRSDSESDNDATGSSKPIPSIHPMTTDDSRNSRTGNRKQILQRDNGGSAVSSTSQNSQSDVIQPASFQTSDIVNEQRDEQLDAWAMEKEQPSKKRKVNGSTYGFQSKFRPPTKSNGGSRPSLKDEQPIFRAPTLPDLGAEKGANQPAFKSVSLDAPDLRRKTRSGASETKEPAFQQREMDALLNKLDKGEQVSGDIFKARDVEKLIQDLPPNSSVSSLSTTTSTFSAPQIPDEDVHSVLTSPLSTPPSSPASSSPTHSKEDKDPHSSTTQCPICRKLVSLATYEAFTTTNNPSHRTRPDRRLNLHAQQRFCAQHTLSDAHSLYTARHYPRFTPDAWTALAQTRIPAHFPHLTRIIQAATPSHYRAMLDRIAALGKPPLRTFLRDLSIDLPSSCASSSSSSSSSIASNTGGGGGASGSVTRHTVTPGYFGPRGRALMASAIVAHFSRDLNALAARDPLVKRIGVAGYVQTVLVPECAGRLVGEDLGVGVGRELGLDEEGGEGEGVGGDGEVGKETDARCRRVLEESAEVGERVNGEVEDVVVLGREDEEEEEEEE